jgi:ElaB/YqjD/DUF883 family membrane-anchored ribosome-binding protein
LVEPWKEKDMTQFSNAGGGRGGSSSTGFERETIASNTSSGGAGAAGQIAERAQERVGQAVDQVQNTAGQVADQARTTMTTQVSSQKDRAAEGLSTFAEAIRETGEHLRDREQGAVAGYVEQAADYVDDLSGFLRERDVNQIVYDVERFARRNPTAFIGGAFAIGLLAGRFLKSSSRSSSGYSDRDYPLAPSSPELGSRAYTYRSGPEYGTGYSAGAPPYRSGSTYGAGTGQSDYGSGSGYTSAGVTTGGATGVETSSAAAGFSGRGTEAATGGITGLSGTGGTTGTRGAEADYTTGGGIADTPSFGETGRVGGTGSGEQVTRRREEP